MSEGLALHWRLITPRYNLQGTACNTCGSNFFPPRSVCPGCRRKGDVEPFNFSGEGEVFSYTIVRVPPTGFEYQKPYVIAVIKLKEGAMLTAQVVDVDIDAVEVGMPVKVTFRKIIADDSAGIIRYGYKFKPVVEDVKVPMHETEKKC